MARANNEVRFDDMFKIEDGVAMPKSSKETLVPEIREIILRSKPIHGDPDGRKKLQAYRELLAVYLIADNRSQARITGLTGDALLSKVRGITQLPDTWKPDKAVLKCIKMYRDTIEDDEISIKVLGTIVNSLKIADDLILKIQGELQKEQVNEGLTLPRLTEIANSISSILKLSTSVTDEIERLDAVKNKIALFERKAKLARGNIVVTKSMEVKR